jgi:ATP-dependent Lhr-like helicase
VTVPPGLPKAFTQPPAEPLIDLVSRFARTRGPFRLEACAERFGIGIAPTRAALEVLKERHRVVEGAFLPGGRGREWCDAEVLRTLRRRSLAKLRKAIEPVEPRALARLYAEWQGLLRPRRGLDALLSAIEQLQGAPLLASALETEVLPARVEAFRASDLDVLCAAGEVVWRGLESVGASDGRVALYLTDQVPLLAPPATKVEGELADRIRGELGRRGALFFADLVRLTSAFPQDLLHALWSLVWAGEATNDTFAPLRALVRASSAKKA